MGVAVSVTLVRTQTLPDLRSAAVPAIQVLTAPDGVAWWDWLPHDVAWYGLARRPVDAPRVWFVGTPRGFEADAFVQALWMMERGDGGLSPLARDTIAHLTAPPPLAVLGVPS